MAKDGGREADKKGAGDDVHKGNGSKSGQDEDKGMNQKKTGGSTATSPPAMEKDSHPASPVTRNSTARAQAMRIGTST